MFMTEPTINPKVLEGLTTLVFSQPVCAGPSKMDEQFFHQRLGPAQDVPFFYTGYHLSELQSCALIFSTNFILFSHLNSAQHNLVIKLCRAPKKKMFLRLFGRLAHSFVAIELLNSSINEKLSFHCSREISVFGILKNPYVNRIGFFTIYAHG